MGTLSRVGLKLSGTLQRPTHPGAPPMSHARRRIAALFALALPAALDAQSGIGSVTGRITGREHRSLAAAVVWIDSGDVRATTNDDGTYRLLRVPAGRHTLSVRFIGYAVSRRDIDVTAGGPTTADVELIEAAQSLAAM